MTLEEEIIAIMQAFILGEKIQSTVYGEEWVDVDIENPEWNFHIRAYRLKPKPLELWVRMNGDSVHAVHVRESDTENTSGIKGSKVFHMVQVDD